MPLNTPIHIPPIGGQTDPEQARVAAIVGGQLASAPARGFGLTPAELTAVQALTALSDFGTGAITLTVVTTSGTYTVPAGLRYLEVTVVGGGGGTYSSAVTAAGQTSVAGGGGGAGAAIKLYAASALSATETYTVGAAGASTGGVTGTAGGNSTFKALTGGGGAPGTAATAAAGTFAISAGGAGGGATGGDINVLGETGGTGVRAAHGSATSLKIGDGGPGFLTTMTVGWVGVATLPGTAGRFPGGGASGAGSSNGGAGQFGAAGGAGCIIFKEFF